MSVSVPPAVQRLLSEATMRFAFKEFQQASTLLLEVVRQCPSLPHPYAALALMYEEMGQAKKALSLFVMAAALSKPQFERWIELTEMALACGETEQVIPPPHTTTAPTSRPSSPGVKPCIQRELCVEHASAPGVDSRHCWSCGTFPRALLALDFMLTMGVASLIFIQSSTRFQVGNAGPRLSRVNRLCECRLDSATDEARASYAVFLSQPAVDHVYATLPRSRSTVTLAPCLVDGSRRCGGRLCSQALSCLNRAVSVRPGDPGTLYQQARRRTVAATACAAAAVAAAACATAPVAAVAAALS
eukprot:6185231-Pleurochrysis_carterae.AAC.1